MRPHVSLSNYLADLYTNPNRILLADTYSAIKMNTREPNHIISPMTKLELAMHIMSKGTWRPIKNDHNCIIYEVHLGTVAMLVVTPEDRLDMRFIIGV